MGKKLQRKFSELLYIAKYISITVSATIIQGPKMGFYAFSGAGSLLDKYI